MFDPQAVFRLRAENENLLDQFRASLGDVCAKLQDSDRTKFAENAQRLYRVEIRPHVEKIEAAISKMRISAYKGSLATALGMALGVITGSTLPLVSILPLMISGAITEGLPSVADYLRERNRPEFIWYKLSRLPRQREVDATAIPGDSGDESISEDHPRSIDMF